MIVLAAGGWRLASLLELSFFASPSLGFSIRKFAENDSPVDETPALFGATPAASDNTERRDEAGRAKCTQSIVRPRRPVIRTLSPDEGANDLCRESDGNCLAGMFLVFI
ncbi:hypothetical protein BDV12DRAFT_192679 [Aspergillus spectabilis]